MKLPPIKVSRRDIPYALANNLDGGTTVAGTMIAAHMAGIPIFATGGIGKFIFSIIVLLNRNPVQFVNNINSNFSLVILNIYYFIHKLQA